VLGRNKLHRLAVVEVQAGKKVFRVAGVITQSDVVHFLARHRHLLGALGEARMASFIGARDVVSVPSTATTREAMQLLVSSKVHGAPVVNGDGVMVANISVSDIRSLAHTKAADVDAVLASNILDFLRLREESEGRPSFSLSPLVVHPEDSFSTAVGLLGESGLHRLVVVDASRRPVGVLSLTDVLTAVAASL
jgi:CBS domain-containing protein